MIDYNTSTKTSWSRNNRFERKEIQLIHYISWQSIWFLHPYRYYSSLVGWN